VIRGDDLSLLPALTFIEESTELEIIERRAIERVMYEVEGNKSRAARHLGISRTQL
jgi:transcriptional regulator with AAA-type ATPase domain